MKISRSSDKYTAGQGVAKQEALKQGREGKLKEFAEKGADVYVQA